MDDLDRARARFPVGTSIVARVVRVPKPGVIGILVDAGEQPEGFVDVLHLPRDPAAWPQVGDESVFVVLQHRPGQMRLIPIDPNWRGESWPLADDKNWADASARYRVGDHVSGRVVQVFYANRECSVDLGGLQAGAEWSGPEPTVGSVQDFRVAAVVEITRTIHLTAT